MHWLLLHRQRISFLLWWSANEPDQGSLNLTLGWCWCVQVGDGSSSEAQLTVYDGASGWSTLHEDDDELQANLETYLGHYLGAAK